MSLARLSSTCSLIERRRRAGFHLRPDLGPADGRRRPSLLGPGRVAVLVAALCLASTAGSALAARRHAYPGGSNRHRTSGAQTTGEHAKGKSGDEEVIIIGHSEGGRREEVIVAGPRGSIGHVSATRGPGGGIGHVTVTGG